MRQKRPREPDLDAAREIASTMPIWPASFSGLLNTGSTAPVIEPHGAGDRGGGAEKDQRVGTIAAVGMKVVLDRPHAGVAELLGPLRELQGSSGLGRENSQGGRSRCLSSDHRPPIERRAEIARRRHLGNLSAICEGARKHGANRSGQARFHHGCGGRTAWPVGVHTVARPRPGQTWRMGSGHGRCGWFGQRLGAGGEVSRGARHRGGRQRGPRCSRHGIGSG